MWNWFIRPKNRNANGWSDIVAGCLVSASGIVFVVLAYDTALRVASALLIAAGVRWIVVGTMQRRDRAATES